MAAMAAPLAADKLGEWEQWIAELTGPRKAELDDLNARHGLDEHRAYLQPQPDGSYLVLVIHEGPGADSFTASVMQSEHEFDRWFVEKVAEIHGFEPGGTPPPSAVRRL